MLEMLLKKINKSKNQKGFTLVELIVVIAILGILAAVAIGRFGGITDKAKLNADYATASEIASAAQAYMAEQPGANVAPTMEELKTANLINDDAAVAQTTDAVFEIAYDEDTKELTVESDGDILYPKPAAE